ncbi:MAG TPA: phosphodiester glycosidase family protein [Candidatus Elarobacter sp.]
MRLRARGAYHRPIASAALWALAIACAGAAPLPLAPAPLPPFPALLAASGEREAVAPGVARATYRLLTAAGPLVVSVVALDPREPTLRLGTVLAHDAIVSKGEQVSSMARRTGAIAGINGDYFDINATGSPLGVLVRNGTLDRTPSTRVALTVTRDRALRFETYRFAGTVTSGPVQFPLTAVNEWPPQSGAALLTPAFGAIPAAGGDITILDLEPLGTGAAGLRYRVSAVAQLPPWGTATGLRLAFGPAAAAFGRLPDNGDVITIAYETDPPLSLVAAAIGGGPLLLRDGVPVDDPASPNYGDRERRIPASAAARLADGTLALVVVDGRHPATSIGVNRAELIALLRALGAVDAMLFDSGGSATLVARVLGDAQASVVNEPSDGVERPVADGLFVYSDAPQGPPARLVLRPGRIVALAGARVPLRARVVDASLHGLGDARGPWRVTRSPLVASIGDDDVLVAGDRTGEGNVSVARGNVGTELPVEVLDRVARITIAPERANPDPRSAVSLTAHAFDARDRPVAVDGLVRWIAKNAAIDPRGRLVAGDRDATVTAGAGGATASAKIPVGRHDVALDLFAERRRAAWKLATAPANGPGGVEVDDGTLRLGYDFTTGERAAYAVNEVLLGEPLALTCAVDGDANGAALRATLADRYGDRQTVAFARALDFTGTRRLTAKVPASLAPPVALRNFYVVGTPANPPVAAAGTIGIRDCVASVPGAGP